MTSPTPALSYEPPYRGLVPRFGMYAGPGYTGGQSWAKNERPDPSAWDVNPNGIVDSDKEPFSNSAVADAAKGLRSMAWVDANADGVIDAADPVFNELRVWQDADGDAMADADELKSLASLGITSLDYANGRFTRNGQYHALQSQDLEASSEGMRVSVLPEGIRVEFSNGQATVFVNNVLDLGAGNDALWAVAA